MVDAKDMTERAGGAGTGTFWLACSCGYPRASMAMKAMALGSHATLSYLWIRSSQPHRITSRNLPMKKPITTEGHLRDAQCTGRIDAAIVRTTREMTLMITMPSVSFRCELTLANVCPPMMQFRIRNPCIEITFKTLGMIDP